MRKIFRENTEPTTGVGKLPNENGMTPISSVLKKLYHRIYWKSMKQVVLCLFYLLVFT